MELLPPTRSAVRRPAAPRSPTRSAARQTQQTSTSEEHNAIVVRNAAITTNTARRGALTPPPPPLGHTEKKYVRKGPLYTSVLTPFSTHFR